MPNLRLHADGLKLCFRPPVSHNVPLGGIDIHFIPRHSLKRKTGDDTISTLMEKEEAHRLIDRMRPNATWGDLMQEIYVRQADERGLADSKVGRTKDVKVVRSKYGLPE